MALGALTGLALGAVIADRVGGMDGLLKKLSKRRRNFTSGELDHDEIGALLLRIESREDVRQVGL